MVGCALIRVTCTSKISLHGFDVALYSNKHGTLCLVYKHLDRDFNLCTCLYFCDIFSRTPIPVIVTELKRDNDDEGLPEKTLIKNNSYFE